MKKTLIALSVFAGLTGVAQADTTTLYGRVGYGMTFEDPTKIGSKTALNLENSGIRFGIKGDEELTNGLTAFYNLEFEYDFGTDYNGNNGALKEIRLANVGLKGQFGSIAFGKMGTLRGKALGQADDFVSLSGSGIGQTRAGKVVSVSTDYNGVIVGASAILDGKADGSPSDVVGGNHRQFNAIEAVAMYSMNGLNTAVWHSNSRSHSNGSKEFFKSDLFGTAHNTDEVLGASVGHQNDVYSIGFDYEHRASMGNYYALGAEYFLDATNTFRAGVEVFDPSSGAKYKDGTPMTKNQYKAQLGYQYNFSKRTFAWVEAAYIRDEGAKDAVTGAIKKQSGYTAVVGIRHNF